MVNQNLNVLVTLKSAAAAAGLAQLGTGVSNLRQNFNKLGLAAGLVVGVLGAKVIQTAIAWESGFAGVKKTVDATAKEFAVLEKQFLALTKRLPVASADILKIGELAGQLGVKKKDIIAFTETIAKLAVTTNLTAESASLDFARFANILQYPIDEIDKLGSVLVDLGNNAATTESDILQAAKEMAGVGKIAGFSGQKILGIASAFSSVGIEAQVAGSSFQKAVLKIHEAAATGESSVAGFAAVAGLGAKEFRELWKTDAAEGFRLFVQGLGEQGDQAAITIGDLIGDDVRLKKAFLSVAAAGDLMTEQMAIAGIAFDENSALAEEASKRFETTESKLILL
ncbi:MAG: phage tail tape measure protein, partial [Spirochaetes bacterium]|nr:phage tail tape measure protein [Spirochaetota bacterium]